jgi:hypothetical protein
MRFAWVGVDGGYGKEPALRDCREFRVWGRTMPLKEPSYVAPQTAYDPG